MEKIIKLKETFISIYNEEAEDFFEVGGRLEIIGNHTDHNHGTCIVGSTDNLVLSCVSRKRKDDIVKVTSKGFPSFEVSLSNLRKLKEEVGTSKGLVKGVLYGFKKRDVKLHGVDLYMETSILPGAGISSSAAFEVLIASIFNHYFNNDHFSKTELAVIGQYAEREYYGKPCGLLDQIGCAYGTFSFVDFEKPEEVKVQPLEFSMPLDIFLINTGGSHEGLDHLYKQIPDDMYCLARNYLNVSFLRESSLIELNKVKNNNDTHLNERVYRRGLHFFRELEAVDMAKNSVINSDVDLFLEAISCSGLSSSNNLQNTMVEGSYMSSPEEALIIARELLKDNGACRIHGGGFMGTVLVFVKKDFTNTFLNELEERYSKDMIIPITPRKTGVKHIKL